MGYSVHVLPEHRLAVVRLTDEVDGPEILRAMRALFLDRRWRPGCRVLWDARAVRVLDLLPEHLPTFAETSAELADRTGPGRSAVLGRGFTTRSPSACWTSAGGATPTGSSGRSRRGATRRPGWRCPRRRLRSRR